MKKDIEKLKGEHSYIFFAIFIEQLYHIHKYSIYGIKSKLLNSFNIKLSIEEIKEILDFDMHYFIPSR